MKWLKNKEIFALEEEIKEGEIYLNQVREETLSLQKQYSELNLDLSNPETLYRKMDRQWDSFIQYSFELNRRQERLYDLKREKKINVFIISLTIGIILVTIPLIWLGICHLHEFKKIIELLSQ
jgi:hypothetical protein